MIELGNILAEDGLLMCSHMQKKWVYCIDNVPVCMILSKCVGDYTWCGHPTMLYSLRERRYFTAFCHGNDFENNLSGYIALLL